MPHSQTIPQETGRGKHLSTHTGISGHPGRSGPFRGRQQRRRELPGFCTGL